MIAPTLSTAHGSINCNLHGRNEPGEPNGVTAIAGQSGSKCQRALPAKLQFEALKHKKTGRTLGSALNFSCN